MPPSFFQVLLQVAGLSDSLSVGQRDTLQCSSAKNLGIKGIVDSTSWNHYFTVAPPSNALGFSKEILPLCMEVAHNICSIP